MWEVNAQKWGRKAKKSNYPANNWTDRIFSDPFFFRRPVAEKQMLTLAAESDRLAVRHAGIRRA